MARLAQAPAGCCSLEEQASCCEPSEKAACCAPEDASCGCSPGEERAGRRALQTPAAPGIRAPGDDRRGRARR
jgi:hypothetical protein